MKVREQKDVPEPSLNVHYEETREDLAVSFNKISPLFSNLGEGGFLS